MNNQLTVIINENQIEPEQANILKVKFTDLIDQAQALSSQADTIKVKDETDVESMQEARTLRLKLKGIRTDTENSRKALKEGIIRAGKAIDGVSNIIKALTTPAEEYLETQEKYAELAKEKAIQTRYETRRDTLSQYVDDVTLYAIKDMPDEVFESLLAGAKQRNEDIKKAEQAAREMEEQRKKEQEIENERIRKENAELKLKAEADSKKQAEEQAKRDEQEKKARTEAEKVKAESDMKLREEQAKAKALQDKLDKEAEEKRRAVEEKELAEAKAKLAPERDKLNEYAERLKSIEAPDGLSKAGMEIIKKAENKLLELSQEIKTLTNQL